MNVEKKTSRSIIVSGTGSDRMAAFSDALSSVQKKVLKDSSEVMLRIEPKVVTVLEAEEQIYKERFLFFFMPREKKKCRVTLQIELELLSIEVESISFNQEDISSQYTINISSFLKDKIMTRGN